MSTKSCIKRRSRKARAACPISREMQFLTGRRSPGTQCASNCACLAPGQSNCSKCYSNSTAEFANETLSTSNTNTRNSMLFPFIILLWISIPGLIAQSAALLPDGQASSYVLGPDDQIVIHGIDIDEIAEKPVQVGQDGQISLPLLGTIRVGGCTVRELEAALRLKLSAIIRSPQVSITVTEFRSQPVSVLGAVNNAGVHQLRGSKTLTEVLSMAGGVRQDAGYRVNVVRKAEWGKIPLSNAHSVESGKYSVA